MSRSVNLSGCLNKLQTTNKTMKKEKHDEKGQNVLERFWSSAQL